VSIFSFLLASSYARWEPSLYSVRLTPPRLLAILTLSSCYVHCILVKLLQFAGICTMSFSYLTLYGHPACVSLQILYRRLFPVRFGIVPIVETEEGVKMVKVFYCLVQNYGRRTTMGFFNSVRSICFSHGSHLCYVRSLL
jgi:UDP-glucose:glycoprotein glucosyltransferase